MKEENRPKAVKDNFGFFAVLCVLQRGADAVEPFLEHASRARGVDAHMTVSVVYEILAKLDEHARAGNALFECLLVGAVGAKIYKSKVRSLRHAEHGLRELIRQQRAHHREIAVQIGS